MTAISPGTRRSRLAREVIITECKTFGHQWDQFTPLTSRVQRGFTLRCDRDCGTERCDECNAQGGLVKRRYSYAKDYADVGVKLTKDELRKAMMRHNRRAAREAA